MALWWKTSPSTVQLSPFTSSAAATREQKAIWCLNSGFIPNNIRRRMKWRVTYVRAWASSWWGWGQADGAALALWDHSFLALTQVFTHHGFTEHITLIAHTDAAWLGVPHLTSGVDFSIFCAGIFVKQKGRCINTRNMCKYRLNSTKTLLCLAVKNRKSGFECFISLTKLMHISHHRKNISHIILLGFRNVATILGSHWLSIKIKTKSEPSVVSTVVNPDLIFNN